MLKLQYFGYLMQKSDTLEEILMVGKIEGRRRGWQKMSSLDDIIDLIDMSLSKLWEIAKDREVCCMQVMGSQIVGHNLVTEQQQKIA